MVVGREGPVLVSVVVPSFKHQDFIGDALASIYRQTYSHIELILIDDKSPDKTYEIAKTLLATQEYKDRFTRIICRRNTTNLGAHKTINLGMSLARGQWISLINSDDLYYNDRLGKLLNYATIHQSDFVFSSTDFLFPTDEHYQESGPSSRGDRLTMKKIADAQRNYWRFPSLKEAMFHSNICATTGNMLFKQEVYSRLGGFADLKYCHDWDFLMRALDSFKVSYLQEDLYTYRLHGANSFKSLDGVGRSESEFVARGVRERNAGNARWEFGGLGLVGEWLGYR